MKRLISFLLGVTAAIAALQPIASQAVFAKGEALSHYVSVCLQKEDAIAIVKAHAEKGLDAAQREWDAHQSCQTVPVINATVGETVFTAKVKVNGDERTARVLEIVRGGSVVGYFLTTLPLISETSM